MKIRYILLIGLLVLVLSGCYSPSSLEKCVDYCIAGKDTSGTDIGDSFDKLYEARAECKQECLNSYLAKGEGGFEE